MSERDLWQEVLLHQIAEARLEPSRWPIPASAYEQTIEARRYLTTPCKDLAMVCAMAGVEVEALLERMQKQVAAVPPVCPEQEDIRPRQKRRQTYTHDGRTLTVPEWAEVTGLSVAAIHGRLRRRWPMGEVLNGALAFNADKASADLETQRARLHPAPEPRLQPDLLPGRP